MRHYTFCTFRLQSQRSFCMDMLSRNKDFVLRRCRIHKLFCGYRISLCKVKKLGSLFIPGYLNYDCHNKNGVLLASVVRWLNNAIHQINRYLVYKCACSCSCFIFAICKYVNKSTYQFKRQGSAGKLMRLM